MSGNAVRRLLWGIVLVPVALVGTFVSTRYLLQENDPEVEVSGQRIRPPWIAPVPAIGPGDGMFSTRPWITNATVIEGELSPYDGSWTSTRLTATSRSQVSFKPGPYVRIVQPLATRRIRNIWGVEVLTWDCRLEGAVSADGSEYCFSIMATGGGDTGFATRFDGDYDPGSRIFTLRVAEKLWRSDGKQFDLRFKVDAAGGISSVDPQQ